MSTWLLFDVGMSVANILCPINLPRHSVSSHKINCPLFFHPSKSVSLWFCLWFRKIFKNMKQSGRFVRWCVLWLRSVPKVIKSCEQVIDVPVATSLDLFEMAIYRYLFLVGDYGCSWWICHADLYALYLFARMGQFFSLI